jgi:hypothetical protein
VIVWGKVYLYGKNTQKTHPALRMRGKQNPEVEFSTTHAEMDSLLKAKRILPEDKWDKSVKKMKMFITRVNPGCVRSMAKPCFYCQRELKKSGFLAKNIFYTDYSGKWTCLEKFEGVE